MSVRRYWIGVAAANHVARCKADGFMQVNHGKQASLRRLQPVDILAYYSPVETFGGKDSLQAFTALALQERANPIKVIWVTGLNRSGVMCGGLTLWPHRLRRCLSNYRSSPTSGNGVKNFALDFLKFLKMISRSSRRPWAIQNCLWLRASFNWP